MRMRKKKNGDQRREACADYFIQEKPYDKTGIMLEIGCGKGGFMLKLARKFPDEQYVCIEKISDVILLAAEKMKREDIPNVKLLNCDAEQLPEYFAEGSVKRIYLNFSDPWPKARHAKRRLTYRSFLEEYRSILPDDGVIEFKTDNRPLFDFSLEEFEAVGMKMTDITYDLHNSEYNADNIMTEYEKNFSEKGFTINRVVVYMHR